MTPEQKLAAIIEAQVKGGYPAFDYFVRDGHLMFHLSYDAFDDPPCHTLEILLDPAGLKAAYGDTDEYCWFCDVKVEPDDRDPIYCDACGDERFTGAAYEYTAKKILDTWLSSDGDPEKTTDTAYQLLPEG